MKFLAHMRTKKQDAELSLLRSLTEQGAINE